MRLVSASIMRMLGINTTPSPSSFLSQPSLSSSSMSCIFLFNQGQGSLNSPCQLNQNIDIRKKFYLTAIEQEKMLP